MSRRKQRLNGNGDGPAMSELWWQKLLLGVAVATLPPLTVELVKWLLGTK
jgi:hypothetical protein